MANAHIYPGQRWTECLSAPRQATRDAVRSLRRPSELGPRLWEWTRAAVARSGPRGGAAGAVCASAGVHRSYAGRGGGAGSAVAGRPACTDAQPDGAGQRERARQAVAAHTTGRDGLAALLDMLALQPGQDGDRDRDRDRERTDPGAAGDPSPPPTTGSRTRPLRPYGPA